MVAERTRDYELVMVLSPEATEDEITAIMDRVDALVKDGGGEVSERDTWGLKRLAYPLKKFNEGNYMLMRFSSDAGALQELNRSFNAAEDILRFLNLSRIIRIANKFLFPFAHIRPFCPCFCPRFLRKFTLVPGLSI